MRPRTPFGFWVAGAFSGWFGVAMLVTALSLRPDGDVTTVLFRGGTALLTVLSAVVTEALWRVRPWVWRASLLLAITYAVGLFLVISTEGSGIAEAVGLLMVSAVVVVPLLAYIRSRAMDFWPRQSSPHSSPSLQVPRPRPPMSPPRHTGWPP